VTPLAEGTLVDLLDAAPDAMLAIDEAGLIVMVNAQAERLFGYRRTELIGRPVELLVPIADPKFRPSATGLEMPGRRQDGSEFSASISVSTMATDDGLLISATIRDATERIEAEAERERLEAEAEADRVKAESEKAEAERVRFKAESEKAKAERVRLKAEADLVKAKSEKAEAERVRFKAEVERVKAESEKAEAERVRLKAEAERVRVKLAAIASQLASAETLSKSEQRFRHAFESNVAGMLFVDEKYKVFAVNGAFCQMIGRTRKEIIDRGMEPFTHPEDLGIAEETYRRLVTREVDRVSYVKRLLHKDGRVISVEVSKTVARDASGGTRYFVISVRDSTEERALNAQLVQQTLHDSLTGLANRLLFDDRLRQAHARAARRGERGAVMLLDIDDFKDVNDSLGHLAGDQVLITLARRLENVTRVGDTLSRFGGDEFLYLAEGLTSEAKAQVVAKRLLGVLDEPFPLAGSSLELHASVGVTVFDGITDDCAELFQEADVALYEAKRLGKGRHLLYTPAMRQKAVSRFALIQELGHALHSGELSMHYQPIVELGSAKVEPTATGIVGFEALMRWQHPERGEVPPDVFIPLAEQSDLICQLGSFALDNAMTEASSWGPIGTSASLPYVTVNLSTRQFHDPDLISTIKALLAINGLAPERLILEITESGVLADVVGATRVIQHLDRLGVNIALDDFGTGYSSLSYLALLRPSIIKIDRSFINPSKASTRNDTLLEAIVSLGQKLNITVLAEGIETQIQLERLRQLGCELGQGYLFSPAVPACEVAAMLGQKSRSGLQRLAPTAAEPPPARNRTRASQP
jgi:Amt family ammonium transporter